MTSNGKKTRIEISIKKGGDSMGDKNPKKAPKKGNDTKKPATTSSAAPAKKAPAKKK